MITIGERVRAVRKSDKVHMTLDEFGDKLGVRKTAISRIENGVNALTDAMKLAICREFGVNQKWLETGEGEMFSPDPQDEIDEIVSKYHLSDGMSVILRQMVQLPADAQDVLLNFIKKTAADLSSSENGGDGEPGDELSAETDTSGEKGRVQPASGSKVLSLEEVRALPLEERLKYMDTVGPEELGLSNLVARKNRKGKDNE